MKAILFNVTNTSHVKSNTGVQKFTRELIFQLKKYFIVIPVCYDPSLKTWRLLNLYEEFNLNIRKKKFKISHSRKPTSTIFSKMQSYFWKNKTSITKVNHINFEFFFNAEIGKSEIKYILNKKLIYKYSVIIIHDLIPLHYWYFSSLKLKLYFFKYLKSTLDYSFIVPVSQYSKNTFLLLLKNFNILLKNNFFINIKPGVSSYFLIKNNLNFLERYFMCIGSMEKRKNYINLLKIIFNIWTKNNLNFKFIFVGGFVNNYSRKLSYLIRLLSKKKYPIIYYKSLSEQKLILMYGSINNLFYLSILEGYGTPIQEALIFKKRSFSFIGGSLKWVNQYNISLRFSNYISNLSFSNCLTREYTIKLYKYYKLILSKFKGKYSWNSYTLKLFNNANHFL